MLQAAIAVPVAPVISRTSLSLQEEIKEFPRRTFHSGYDMLNSDNLEQVMTKRKLKIMRGATGQMRKSCSSADTMKPENDPQLLLDAEEYRRAFERGGFILTLQKEEVVSAEEEFIVVGPSGSKFVHGRRNAWLTWKTLMKPAGVQDETVELVISRCDPGAALFVVFSGENAISLLNCLGSSQTPFIIAVSGNARSLKSPPNALTVSSVPGIPDWKFYWKDRSGGMHVRKLVDLHMLSKSANQLEAHTSYNIAGDFKSLFDEHFGDVLMNIIPKEVYEEMTEKAKLDMIGMRWVLDKADSELQLSKQHDNHDIKKRARTI